MKFKNCILLSVMSLLTLGAPTKTFATNIKANSPDGSSVQVKPDGTKTIQEADGTWIQVNPDGSKIIKKPDGSVINVKPDGTKTVKKPDGTKLEIKPGS